MKSTVRSIAFIALLMSCKSGVKSHGRPLIEAQESSSGKTFKLIKIFERIEAAGDDKPYVVIVEVGRFSLMGPLESHPILVRLASLPDIAEGSCFTTEAAQRELTWREKECPLFPNRTGAPWPPIL
jgi:hypothetical protein